MFMAIAEIRPSADSDAIKASIRKHIEKDAKAGTSTLARNVRDSLVGVVEKVGFRRNVIGSRIKYK